MSQAGMCRLLGPSDRQPIVSGRVGFDSLPDQLVNKAVARGFDFTILCVGEAGIGKSTLMDTIFKADLADEPHTGATEKVTLETHTYTLKESQVNLRLRIVDTVGFGDQLGRGDSAAPVVDYINQQFDNYLQEELRIRRDLSKFQDTRIHVCIYFLPPTGHSLKALDIACMKELMTKVNVIPVISKADTIGKNEMIRFKQRIMQDLKANDIEIYKFPTDDKTVAEINQKMNDLAPFGVIGSRDEIEVNGQKVRARLYPWGTVEVENETHCDFIQLREMLIRTNMEDLRERTHNTHYERYRKKALANMGYLSHDGSDQPVRLSDLIQMKRTEQEETLKRVEEQVHQRFLEKVMKMESKLKAEEREIQEKSAAMKKEFGDSKKSLEERKWELEEEIAQFRKHRADAQAAQAQAVRENSLPQSDSKRGRK